MEKNIMNWLKQYSKLKREIKTLEARLSKLTMRKYKYGVDTVSMSSPNSPYTKHNITIAGYGCDATDDSRKRKFIKYVKERLSKAQKDFDEINVFIESIDDSEIRQIIEYKYIDGLSWNMTAVKVYGFPHGNNALMRLKRFLEKL